MLLTVAFAGLVGLLLVGLTTNLLNYVASSALTITLNSLASSASLLTGRQSTAVDNTTNKYLDYHLSGQFKVGTTPTSGTYIYVYVVSMIDDTTWPTASTGFGATDAAATLATAGQGGSYLKLAAAISVDSATTGVVYGFGKVSVAQLFGGVCPPKFVVFVTQNTGAALDGTAGGTITAAGIDSTNG